MNCYRKNHNSPELSDRKEDNKIKAQKMTVWMGFKPVYYMSMVLCSDLNPINTFYVDSPIMWYVIIHHMVRHFTSSNCA